MSAASVVGVASGPGVIPATVLTASATPTNNATRPTQQQMNPDPAEGFSALQNYMLYESRTLMIVTGSDKSNRFFRLLTFDRTSPYDLRVSEDPNTYNSQKEIDLKVMELIRHSGAPLERTMKVAAILGFIRLPKVFMVLVLNRDKVGSIGGRWIYSISDWKLKAIGHKSYDRNRPPAVGKYKKMIEEDIELNKDFYFSYFYDLTNSLQNNMMSWRGESIKQLRQRERSSSSFTAPFSSSVTMDTPPSTSATPSSVASAAAAAEPLLDPIAFDPIVNSIPAGRRRSTTSIAPPPNLLASNAPSIPSVDQIDEGDESESIASSLATKESSHILLDEKADDFSSASTTTSINHAPFDPLLPSLPTVASTTVLPSLAPKSDSTSTTARFLPTAIIDPTPPPLPPLPTTPSPPIHIDSDNKLLNDATTSGGASTSRTIPSHPPPPPPAPATNTTNPSASLASTLHATGGTEHTPASVFFGAHLDSPDPSGVGAGGIGAGVGGVSNRTSTNDAPPPPYSEKWLWNLHLAREFLHYLPHGSYWLVPLIHGFVQQHSLKIGRRDVLVTLMARRSRHFAGTRYIKRGVSSLGHVANEVETEQILQDRSSWSLGIGAFSSVTILRGSIPLYWSQENVKSMKPDIVVYNFDRDHSATKKHFQDCFDRYGSPCAVLSLIKKEERSAQETRLGMAFNHAIQRVSAQFRMDRIRAQMMTGSANGYGSTPSPASSSSRGPSVGDDLEREITERIAREGNAPFPIGQGTAHSAALASVVVPVATIDERSYTLQPPPYNHPSYEPNSILYCTYDFLTQRSKQQNVLRDIKGLVTNLVEEIGVFTYTSRSTSAASSVATITTPPLSGDPAVLSVQKGTIRVNCIDCLDRTNVGQFCIGKAAIKVQLRSLGIQLDPSIDDMPISGGGSGSVGVGGGSILGLLAGQSSAQQSVDVYPELVAILQDMYTQHGDRIAHQYAGSGAMHKEIIYDTDGGDSNPNDDVDLGSLSEFDASNGRARRTDTTATKPTAGSAVPPPMSKNITQNALSAIKRYYNNNFNDSDKQSAINVFLGNYIPNLITQKPSIWELDVYANLRDSDQLFSRDGDRFRPPFIPHRLCGSGRAIRTNNHIKSKLIQAAIGSPASPTSTASSSLSSPSLTHTPDAISPLPSPLSPLPSSSSSLTPHHRLRYEQYFNETYHPRLITSFDDDLKKSFETPIVVKLQPGMMDATYETSMTTSTASTATPAASLSAPSKNDDRPTRSPIRIDAPSSVTGTGVVSTTPSLTSIHEDDAVLVTPPMTPAASPQLTHAPSAPSSLPPSGSPAAQPSSAVAPPPASTSKLKRGFGSLFSSAKASFQAALSSSKDTNKTNTTGTPATATTTNTATPPTTTAVQHAPPPVPPRPSTAGTANKSTPNNLPIATPVSSAASPPTAAGGVTSFSSLIHASLNDSSSSSSSSSLSFSSSSSVSVSSSSGVLSSSDLSSYPTSFLSPSTSGTMYTGWSPRITHKYQQTNNANQLQHKRDNSMANVRLHEQDVSPDQSTLDRYAEYAEYMDTSRLLNSSSSIVGTSASTISSPRSLPPATAIDLSPPHIGLDSSTIRPSDDHRAEQLLLADRTLLSASPRMSHQQLVDLLASNLHDLHTLHEQVNQLTSENIRLASSHAAGDAGDRKIYPITQLSLDSTSVAHPIETPEVRKAQADATAKAMIERM